MSRSLSTSSPTHTLLRRATSKTAKGSSIIRKDGSLIITKNGKIISVRRDTDSVKRDRSFSGFEDITIRRTNGVTKSLSELNVNDKVELTPLLQRDIQELVQNNTNHACNMPTRMKFSHSSLTKIDSVDENEIETQHGNRLKIPGRLDRHLSQSSDAVANIPTGEDTLPIILTPSDRSNSPSISMKSECDDVFVQSPDKLNPTYHSQEGLLNTMPLEPVLKDSNQFARSENHLDSMEKGKIPETKSKVKVTNSSSNISYKIPLLRYPSIEKLDTHAAIPRCSSDATTVRKLMPRSPLYIRRFLSNKRIDQPAKQKT